MMAVFPLIQSFHTHKYLLSRDGQFPDSHAHCMIHRFVGHTGVLMETEDGLLFVEKYGPAGPFQATKFESRNALEHYLLARPDLYGDETELLPIEIGRASCRERVSSPV